jgi:hypothetical protein
MLCFNPKRNPMKKHDIALISSLVMWMISMYAIVAFISWQTNPNLWNGSERLWFIVIGPCAGILLATGSLRGEDEPIKVKSDDVC